MGIFGFINRQKRTLISEYHRGLRTGIGIGRRQILVEVAKRARQKRSAEPCTVEEKKA